MEDVISFLEHVLRGKNVPRERMLEVAEHYYHFHGRNEPVRGTTPGVCGLLSQAVGRPGPLVYQSRSGPPMQPWLEPDVCASIRQMHAGGCLKDLVLAPIGFLSDHMEVIYDLDTEAAALCRELGVNLSRAATVGAHPAFVSMPQHGKRPVRYLRAGLLPSAKAGAGQIRGGTVTTMARAPAFPAPR